MTTTLAYNFQKRKFSIAPYKDSWHEFEAFDGDRFVGRIVCFEAPRGSHDCWIHDLWVAPWSRGSGLGSELLRLAVDTARAHRYLRMLGELRAYDSVPRAGLEAFFKRHGFSIEEDWDGTGKPVVVLMLA